MTQLPNTWLLVKPTKEKGFDVNIKFNYNM